MYTQQRGKKNVPRPAAAVVHGRVISLFFFFLLIVFFFFFLLRLLFSASNLPSNQRHLP